MVVTPANRPTQATWLRNTKAAQDNDDDDGDDDDDDDYEKQRFISVCFISASFVHSFATVNRLKA